jgi:hypothetical protein
MKNQSLILTTFTVAAGLCGSQAAAADLTLPVGGRVVLEMITSDAAFSNTIALKTPNTAVVTTGCEIEPSAGLTGLKLLSDKVSQRGCRVELDADAATPGIQPFAAGTVLQFDMCAQIDSDDDCDYIWSSNPAENSDGMDHVKTTELYDGDPDVDDHVFNLAWEDLENLGDNDFNDLIAVVRIAQDSDGDGLWDDWEKFGIDTNGDGIADFTLPGADPQHKDIYLEIDYMDCAVAGGDCAAGDTHSHQPKQDAIDEVVQAFADAPVANPDGIDGIALHVDVDDALPHSDALDMGCFGSSAAFDAVKNDPAYFGPFNPRRYAYHYVIFGHQQTPATTSSGCGEVNGNDFIVTLGGWTDDVGTVRQQSGTLMHELGHNLNLRHGGAVNDNYKPNYLSVMSYRYQFSGILPTGRLDYSRSALNPLDEAALDETLGIAAGADNTRYNCPDATVRTGSGVGPIDWNCDDDGGADTNVAVNINNENGLSVLTGYNDWDNLKYDFQDSGNFQDGVHAELDIPDMDLQTYMLVINHPPVADAGPDQTVECTSPDGAAVTLDGSGSHDADGDELTYTWKGLFGTLTGKVVEAVLPHGTHTVSLTVEDGKGGSDGDTVMVVVNDTTAPEIDVTLSPDALWPANHKLAEITATVTVSDNCDPNPTVTLISITSNEADNGHGDGNSADDIQHADFGTDDRTFSLRAERSGASGGRVYTVTYRVTDASGNSAEISTDVTVSHDRRK